MAGRTLRALGVGVLVLVLIGAAAVLLLQPPRARPATPIQIADGLIQGSREGSLTVYRGIPYAAPPIGDLRWRPPQPPAPWKGVLTAEVFKPVCPQVGPSVPGMEVERYSEDCLYLNVWTPAPRSSAKLPVMVWLYGGGNINGSGSARAYSGAYLAKYGVVVVNFNYRLGALGLLAHPQLSKESEHGVSGNYLLFDQIAALRWVQQNIGAFGGDAGNVTVFGHSAGAYNISKLIASPLAEGLFQRAIGESGADFGVTDGGVGPRSLAAEERLGTEFVARLHVDSIEQLRKVPVEKLLAVSDIDLRLNVDGYVSPNDSSAQYRAGKQHPVDLLVGYTENDGAAESPPVSFATFEPEVRKKYRDFADRLLAFYPHATEAQARHSWERLQTEEIFEWQAITWARLHRATLGHHTYLYIFTHRPPFGSFKQSGAGHGAEIVYVLGTLPPLLFYGMENPARAYQDGRIAREIQTYWTNFAKTGNPNGAGLPPWPTFDARQQVLDIGDTMKVVELPHPQEYELMDAFMESLRTRP